MEFWRWTDNTIVRKWPRGMVDACLTRSLFLFSPCEAMPWSTRLAVNGFPVRWAYLQSPVTPNSFSNTPDSFFYR